MWRIPAVYRGIVCLVAIVLAAVALVGLVTSGLNLELLSHGDFQWQRPSVAPFVAAFPTFASLWWVLFVACIAYAIYLLMQYVNSRFALLSDSRSYSRIAGPAPASLPLPHVNSDKQAEFFRDFVLGPEGRILRIAESVEPYTRSLLVKTGFTISTHGIPSRTSIMVPVVVSQRGRLEDGIRFFDGDEKRISSLTHEQSIAYLLAIIERLVKMIGPGVARRYRRSRPQGSVAEHVATILRERRPLPDLRPTDLSRAEAEFVEVINELFSIAPNAPESVLDVAQIIQAFRWEYPVCVPAVTSRSGMLRLSVERRVTVNIREYRLLTFLKLELYSLRKLLTTPDGHRLGVPRRLALVLQLTVREGRKILLAIAKTAVTRGVARLRHFFGIRTNVLGHSLANSGRARSYHLQIKGPQDMFVGTQGLVAAPTGIPLGLRSLRQIDYQVSPMAGQRHAHLHIQDGGETTRALVFRVSFLERTPGSMARASLTAIAAAVVVVTIALVQLHSLDVACATQNVLCSPAAPATGTSDSGLLQVLLALPLAFTTTSFAQGVSFWGGILAARIANFMTMVFSFAALFTSALASRFTVDGLGIVWLVVAGGTVLTAVICVLSWIWRANAHASYVMSTKGEF
jgi:hypothetical protein